MLLTYILAKQVFNGYLLDASTGYLMTSPLSRRYVLLHSGTAGKVYFPCLITRLLITNMGQNIHQIDTEKIPKYSI